MKISIECENGRIRANIEGQVENQEQVATIGALFGAYFADSIAPGHEKEAILGLKCMVLKGIDTFCAKRDIVLTAKEDAELNAAALGIVANTNIHAENQPSNVPVNPMPLPTPENPERKTMEWHRPVCENIPTRWAEKEKEEKNEK